jgi:hypothetical protein
MFIKNINSLEYLLSQMNNYGLENDDGIERKEMGVMKDQGVSSKKKKLHEDLYDYIKKNKDNERSDRI